MDAFVQTIGLPEIPAEAYPYGGTLISRFVHTDQLPALVKEARARKAASWSRSGTDSDGYTTISLHVPPRNAVVHRV